MDKYSHVFGRFVEFENLYDGYILARRNKRFRDEVLAYTANLEENLINSQNHLICHTYKVNHMHEFLEYFPKKRIITVLPFENRVVNCAAFNVLWDIYSKSFYEHSYGSIKGKGPIKAAQQLQYWMRLVQNKPEQWYLCKMDITKFFFRIPQEVQYKYLYKPLDDPDMEWFLKQAVECDGRAFGLPVDADNVTECERVQGVGMQVGSLISQMTGNVVMTPADQYIKRVLGAPYYIRYMDDMIFLCPSKQQAWDILGAFEDYLWDELGLQLNNKTAIMPADAGVEFVGKRIYPDRIQIRRSSSLHMKQHLNYVMEHYSTGELPLEYCLSVIRSYLGYMKYCDCDALRKKTLEDFVLVRHFADEKNIYPD